MEKVEATTRNRNKISNVGGKKTCKRGKDQIEKRKRKKRRKLQSVKTIGTKIRSKTPQQD